LKRTAIHLIGLAIHARSRPGGGWGGPIDDSIFPQRMTVDYVRVYQKQVASP
jgi:hypothetical protein